MSSIYSNYNINNNFAIPHLGFKSNADTYTPVTSPVKDSYVTNPLYKKFGTKQEIEASAKSNPRIQEILKENNIPLKVNEKELEKLKNGHLQRTRITAAKIYSNLPKELKQQVNPQVLQEAAMFHDYGKILIPDKILNKSSALSPSEWTVMEQHAELGAELLKDKNMSPRTLELVKYHHRNIRGEGYPAAGNGYKYGLDSEILATADKYEALTEQRSYKNAMTRDEALAIIEEDVKSGLISREVFNALKKAV